MTIAEVKAWANKHQAEFFSTPVIMQNFSDTPGNVVALWSPDNGENYLIHIISEWKYKGKVHRGDYVIDCTNNLDMAIQIFYDRLHGEMQWGRKINHYHWSHISPNTHEPDKNFGKKYSFTAFDIIRFPIQERMKR